MMRRYLILLLAAFLSINAMAQAFSVTYDFSGVTTSSGTTDPTPVPTSTGVTFGSFNAVGTPTNANASGRFSFTGWALGATNGSNTFTGSLNTAEYYEVIIAPQNNYSLDLSSIKFTVQRSGTGVRQYAVRSSLDGYTANLPASISPSNAALQVVTGNVFQIDDGTTTATDGSTITLSGFTGISTPISLRFYGWNAESNAGTFSIDNVNIVGQAAPAVGAPIVSVSTTSVVFPSTNVNTVAPVMNYTVSAANLSTDLVIATTAPYSVSADNISFSSSINFTPAQMGSPKTVYVRFAPTTPGTYSRTITHNSTGANEKVVALSGEGVDPAVFNFNFNTCTDLNVPGSGFIAYSVTGAQQWTCTTFGRNFTNGVQMNGYFGGSLNNEDWLISPALNLSGFNLPVLSFFSRGEFSGLPLELFVSTNYIGYGDPNAATWTKLNGYFPQTGTNTWTPSDNINLSAYKSAPNVYIAFRYLSSPVWGAPRWSLDDIAIFDRTQLLAVDPLTLDLGDAAVGSSGTSKPVSIQGIGYGNITITAPTGFEVSTNNSTFFPSITLPQATAEAGTTFYVRFTPVVKAIKVTGSLTLTGTGLNTQRVDMTASSYPRSETLDVVTWNMKFFGSSPTNTTTPAAMEAQKTNARTVLQKLNADVYGVQEISNDSLFNRLVLEMPGYDKKVSDRWSYSWTPPDPNFPPQKVAFIYNTNTMQVLEERVMFRKLFDDARAGLGTIPSYPGGNPVNFWSSGRLPYMVTFKATINGNSRIVRMIDIHAKSGSSTSDDYQRRVYDVRTLKDTLDLYYPTDSIIIIGDYNDNLILSEYGTTNPSPYKIMIDDAARYEGISLPLTNASRVTYIGSASGSMIDHQIASNEMRLSYVTNSVDIEDPRSYIPNFSSNTSDHLPVIARYDFLNTSLPLTWGSIDARQKDADVEVDWSTLNEVNTSHFVLERSADGVHFEPMGKVAATGNSTITSRYRYTDKLPLQGINYYRVKQVDVDGRFTYSPVVKVRVDAWGGMVIRVSPMPVSKTIVVSGIPAGMVCGWQLIGADGRMVRSGKGNAAAISSGLQRGLPSLSSGLYLIRIEANGSSRTVRFLKD